MAEAKFEKDLERLEHIVEALEEGGLSLDDSLKRFEEGIKLAQRCEKALSEAEKKIEILLTNAEGKIEAQPFEETDEPAAQKRTPRKKGAPEGSDGSDRSDGSDGSEEDSLF